MTARERRLVLGLGGTLAALLAVIVLVVRHDARDDVAVTSATTGTPSRVTIERPDRDALVLAREDGDWRLIEPCPIDAEDARVEPLVEALALTASAPGYPAAEVDLEAAGLVEPLATVRLDDEPVRLGGTDLDGERRYARRASRVSFVPAWTLSLVEGGLSAIAVPSPFEGAPRAVRRLAPDDPPNEPSAEPGLAVAVDDPADGAGTTADEAAPNESTADGTPADGPTTEEPAAAGPAALDPAPWAALAARQVVTWPVPNAPRATRRARLEVTLDSGATRRLDVEANARWTALRVDGGDCAFLFGPDELPPDLYR